MQARSESIKLEVKDQVATVIFPARDQKRVKESHSDSHWDLANILADLRSNDDIRLIVLTGQGKEFSVPPPLSYYENEGRVNLVDPVRSWRSITGIIRVHQTMAEIEKPIIAKVNGDAVGFGQSVMFGSDLIVANEKARIFDHHMGTDEVQGFHDWGNVPGDGGCALLPLFMSPPKAKEYLILGKVYTARELADQGIINYAVPAAELDTLVNSIVNRILKRPAYAVAWSKRVVNRKIIDQLNLTLDAGIAYENVQLMQLEKLGWKNKTTLG